MKLLRDHKNFKSLAFVWAAGMLACLGLYLFMWQPRHQLVNTTRSQVDQKESDLKAIVESTSPAARAILRKQMEEKLEKLNTFAVELEQSSALPLDVSRVAGQIPLDNFSSQSKTEKAFMEIPNCVSIGEKYIEVTFKGSFNQFAFFLNAMERFRPLIFVDRFKINKLRRSALNPDQHEINMTLAVLVRHQLKKLNDTAQAGSPERAPTFHAKREPMLVSHNFHRKAF
jgi:hypothetical protein